VQHSDRFAQRGRRALTQGSRLRVVRIPVARKRILEAWPHIQKGRIETIFVEADELVLRRLRAATDDAQS
jgi:hypothetical protein